MPRILWTDDQMDIIATLRGLLASLGPDITPVANSTDALQLLKREQFDLILLDLQMPPEPWGGLWLLEQMRAEGIARPTIVLSGEGTQRETILAMRLGATDYVTKDHVQIELLDRVCGVLEQSARALDVPQLIARGENEEIELKKSLAERTEALKTMAAFACQDGGTVVFGVAPNGRIVGTTIGEDTLERLAQAAGTMIEPPIYPRIRYLDVQGRTVLAVEVTADGRVHTFDGRFYKRVGRATVAASPDEYRRQLLARG